MKQALMQWIHTEESSSFHYAMERTNVFFFRVRKNEQFDYLYYADASRESGITRQTGLQYAGFFHRRDGILYDVKYSLKQVLRDAELLVADDADQILTQFRSRVCEAVEAKIGNDRSNLHIHEIQDSRTAETLRSYVEYYAAADARKAYLNNEDIAEITFKCDYTPTPWTEESLLEYIAGRSDYVEREAIAYIEANQDVMLQNFLANDALIAEYHLLLEDTGKPVHKLRRIMAAMNSTIAKSVSVTVRIDGTEATFKTEADVLRRDCGLHYSTYRMAAADRKVFELVFGRHKDYAPQDIIKITYGKQTLYSAE